MFYPPWVEPTSANVDHGCRFRCCGPLFGGTSGSVDLGPGKVVVFIASNQITSNRAGKPRGELRDLLRDPTDTFAVPHVLWPPTDGEAGADLSKLCAGCTSPEDLIELSEYGLPAARYYDRQRRPESSTWLHT